MNSIKNSLCFLAFILGVQAFAQCDFVTNITGITQTVLPVGDAADPLLYTQTYVLVDNQGLIYATSSTPDFVSVDAGFYNLYAVNYDVNETSSVLPLLAVGQAWFDVVMYGDNNSNCLDYSLPYGSGCPIVVCEEMSICEFDTLNTSALGYNTIDHEQRYCLVCNDIVLAIQTNSSFPFQDYPAATAGAYCQLFGLNYNTSSGCL